MATPLTSKPYPGLRPFDSEELDIFFGREHQTDELLARLQKHRLLAVIGPSGCGKSSLVRAGMIPALQSGFIVETGSSWQIAQMRPGEHPLLNLAEALLAPHLLGEQREGSDALLYLKASLKRGPLSLVEILRESGASQQANFLLVVDQFEELFRFRRQGGVDEAEAFVSLLLATAAQREVPIFVVITMRSDFLGHCTLFHGLPEAINDCQYLTPRLTREECADAITGPAQVLGGAIDPALLNRLLNDFGPDPDQLPLLQHALMRMWELHVVDGAPEASIVLTVEDYERVGGLQRALSCHGDEILATLTPEQRHIAEVMFRRLVDLNSAKPDTRSSAELGEIAAIAERPESEVAAVVEVFRDRTCSFLTARAGPLESETLIDIGHESLIRKWTTLSTWVSDEAEAVTTYRRLRETAKLWSRRKAALWRTPDLELALAWQRNAKPSAAWAARFGEPDDLPLALKFLNASEQQQRDEESREKETQTRRLRRATFWAASATIIATILLASWILYLHLYKWDYDQFFNTFINQHDVPVGIGKLTQRELSHREMSFRIIRQGRWGNVRRLEAVNGSLRPTAHHNVGTYLEYVNESLFREPDQVVAWEYAYGPQGEVASQTAMDVAGKVVWRFAFLPEDADAADTRKVRRGYLVGSNGLPRAESHEQQSIIEIHYTPDGREQRVLYRNRNGKPIKAKDDAYGQEFVYDNGNSRLIAQTSLGPDEKPMIDVVGNATLRFDEVDRFGNSTVDVAVGTQGELVKLVRQQGGWTKRKSETDEYGRLTSESYFDARDVAIIHTINRYHRRTVEYDDHGNMTRERYIDASGSPTTDNSYCHALAWEFDDRDRLIKETCQGVDGLPVPNRNHVASKLFSYSGDFLAEESFVDRDGNPTFYTWGGRQEEAKSTTDGYAAIRFGRDDRGRIIEERFLGLDGALTTTRQGFARIQTKFNEHGLVESKSFFGPDDKLVLHERLGYASWRQDYDAYGNILRTQYFGTDGKRILARTEDGVNSGWTATYDANGNLIEKMWVDVTGAVTLSNGRAGERHEYDDKDKLIRTTLIGLKREPVEVDGIAQFQFDYTNTLQSGARFFDKNLTRLKGRVSGWSEDFDAAGREIVIRYLDESDKPFLKAEHNFATRKLEYDSTGNTTRQVDLDEHDRPILIAESSYDAGGNLRETLYRDSTEQPRKTPHARERYKYDAGANLEEVSYYAADDQLTVSPDVHCAKVVWDYDASRREIAESCYGSDNLLMERAAPGGHMKITYAYDHRGNVTEARYLGPGNSPARIWMSAVSDGQSMTKYQYDAFGNSIEELYFDENGKRVHGYSRYGERCYRWTASYNFDGSMKSPKGTCHPIEN